MLREGRDGMLEDEVREALESDPEGFAGIEYRDVVLFIANGVCDPGRIREYLDAGIGPELAGEMELY